VRGLEQVLKAEEHAASGRGDGKTIGFKIVSKYVTAELAYVVQLEHLLTISKLSRSVIIASDPY
jgi:hypothetical protein